MTTLGQTIAILANRQGAIMRSVFAAILFVAVAAVPDRAAASQIDFTQGFTALATIHTEGSLLVDPSWTWNGAPLSPTNQPSAGNLFLAADVNLFMELDDPTQLYMQITNVITTQSAFWFGSAIPATVLTGVRLLNTPAEPLPSLLTQYANLGQTVDTCGDVQPLSDTPGYRVDQSGAGWLVHTSNGSNYGFTSLPSSLRQNDCAPRILGGGAFGLTFSPTTDLSKLDWSTTMIALEFGAGRQYLPDSLAPPPSPPDSSPPPVPVPEPSSLVLLLGGSVWVMRRRLMH